MSRVLAVLILCLVPFAAFAQSADQEVVSVVDSPDPVTPGATLTYTVTIRNNGPDPATNGGLNINLPLSVIHTTDVVPAGWTCFWIGSNGTCNTPSFAAGVTQVLTINTTVEPSLAAFADQSISANFFPSGVTPDPNSGNNTKGATTFVDSAQVDLTVSATDSPDPVTIDGNVTYTVNVANEGPDTASTVNFNVVPTSSLTFQSATAPPGWNCTLPAVGTFNASFNCNRATWAPGSGVFTVVYAATDEGFGINDTTFFTNFSIGASLSNETDHTDNTTTVSTTYSTADADMNITATDSPDPVFPDGDITYTVTVTNQGPDAAPNSQMTVVGNGGQTRFVSGTQPAGWTCVFPAPGTLLNVGGYQCTNPSFASGASSVFTVVTNAADDLHPNSDHAILQAFSTNSAVADPDHLDNSITLSTQYDVTNADIAVTNSDSPDPVQQGDTITYTQTITNQGPETATNASISQILDGSTTFQSLSSVAGWNCTTPAVGASGAITCTNASFASGASASFTLVVEVVAASGFISNTVTGSSNASDTDQTDNSANVVTTILAPAVSDLALTKTGNVATATEGGSVTYTITLTNNGPDPAANVVVTDSLPASLLFQSITNPAGWSCTTPAVGSTGSINCSIATFPSGTTAIFTLVVQVATGATSPINNNAGVTSSTGDPNGGNNTGGSTPVTVGPANTADLGSTKTTSSTNVAPGNTVVYTITANNAGPDNADNATMTDTLPSTLLFQSITNPSGWSCTTPAVGTTGTITCSNASFANGASAVFTLTTTVAPGASGSIVNSVSTSTSDTDPNGGNNSGTAPTVTAAAPSADLSISKTTSSASATTGGTITYTVTVTNNGPSAATNVVVNDDLPTGLTFVSATPSQGSCNAADPIVCSLGTLANGASATISITAMVTATSGTISNTATVTATETDPTGGNNTSATPPIPAAPPAPQAEQIPTLSEWALLAFAVLLGGVAIAKRM